MKHQQPRSPDRSIVARLQLCSCLARLREPPAHRLVLGPDEPVALASLTDALPRAYTYFGLKKVMKKARCHHAQDACER